MVDITAEGAPTCATAVANAFLDIQDGDASRFPSIDQMKLQKLVFYAHAWWLAYTGKPLYGEDVEAWPWGPVVGTVYGNFRKFGRDAIVGARAQDLVKDSNGYFVFKQPPPPPDNVMKFLRNVWETHKNLTGIQLSNSTHAQGEPWTIVKEKYGSLDTKPRIPNSLIRDVFKNKLPGQRN